ncbi:MAG: SPFH domain-containing protein [Myxococcota bacterium]|jgi:regulator of protease activity HflC (stomatin/prohibitin superfamily)
MKRLGLLLLFASFTGCTCHSTGANEVGVLTRKVGVFGKKGVQDEVYAAGATYFFPAFITDWHTFETKLQNLRMSKAPGEDGLVDDVEFKTVDGNDISVDVTVAWRIDPAKAPHVLQRVGESTEDVQERLVRPAARAYVRDALNRLRSEDFYVADKRFAAAEEAKTLLTNALVPEGVVVEQVILGEHRFHPAYEEVIREKKLAEQNAEKLKSEASAALEEAKRNLESARGRVAQQIAKAKGELEQARLSADAALVRSKNEAEAILAESKARAQGIEKENAALAGAGGRTMVKLRIAEALQGKRVVMVPTGKGANLQTLDVNDLITATAARRAADKLSE